MGTGQYKQNIDLCFTEYENLQEKHLHAVKNDATPDLAAMTKERDRVFIRLKQTLDAFVETTENPDKKDCLPQLEFCKTRLADIMAGSETLSKAIQDYRENLKTNLIQMQQGKAAMKGYKTAGTNY